MRALSIDELDAVSGGAVNPEVITVVGPTPYRSPFAPTYNLDAVGSSWGGWHWDTGNAINYQQIDYGPPLRPRNRLKGSANLSLDTGRSRRDTGKRSSAC